MKSENRIYQNIPQLLFHIIRAHITICLWGRATGKTEGPGVDFTLHNMVTMPRSLGAIVSVSYDKLLTFIIPKLTKGWEKYGYLEDTHFWVRKFAPEHLMLKTPILKPSDPKHFIHFYNGAGAQLISLDRLGLSNAADLDWIYADEARLFSYEKFVEVINANRGNADVFGGMPEHHSILITTDKPRDSKGQWLFDLAEQSDPEAIEMIMQIQESLFNLNEELKKARTKAARTKIESLISEFENNLREIRKDTIALIEASTLDNIHALGIDPIKNFVRTLSDIVYKVSILNETINEVEDGFYPDLSEEKHGYISTNFDYLDHAEISTRNPKPDCRWYNDTVPNAPLDIAMDTNAKICNIATGQGNSEVYRLLSSFYHRNTFQDLLKQWSEFYEHHPTKVVTYFFDHTDVKGRADSEINYAQEIQLTLGQLGWNVNPVYIGQQPRFKARYILWQKMLTESDPAYPKFRYNKITSEYWKERAEATGTIVGRTGFEKDKREEKRQGFDQAKAPHITDAGDTLIMGAVQLRLTGSTDFLDIDIR